MLVLGCCATIAWLTGWQARLFVSLFVLLFIPGYVIDQFLRPIPAAPFLVRLTIWLGLSLSVVPLLYEWVTVAGLSLSPFILQLLTAAGLLTALVFFWRSDSDGKPHTPITITIALAIVFGGTLWVRFIQIGGMAFPAWVDSLHHALLIEVAAEQGRAPYLLEPYLPVDGLTYHWGYHVFCATVLRVAGVPLPEALPQAMLWIGQSLGALIVVVSAGLGIGLWRRPIAGVVAGIVAGLISIMPAYYVSWGRYTLLAGLLILPAALIMLRAVQHTPSRSRIAVATLVIAGLSLVHFVIFVFALVWYLTVLLIDRGLFQGYRASQSAIWLRANIIRGSPLLFTGALTLPWLMLLLTRTRSGTGMSAMHVAGNSAYNAMPLDLLWAGNNAWLLALAACGALLACLYRKQSMALILVWSLLLAILANPVWFGLPYLSFITNETLAITLFLPAALLIGGGVAVLDRQIESRLAPVPNRHRTLAVYRLVCVVILMALAGWGAWQSRAIIRPDTILAIQDDLLAIRWAATETPPDARFVVNTVGWLGDVDRGADGGWWLLPLAKRQVSTPPVVYTYGPDEYVAMVKQETGWLRSLSEPNPIVLGDFMRRNGYTHVYATRNGRVLSLQLRESPLFEEVYANSTVSILRLR